MKGPVIRAVCLALCLLNACSPKIVETIRTETVTEVRDSIAWRDTTIYVPVPLEADQAIVQVGDTSHRETSVAESDAWIDGQGLLHHTLRNKPARIPYKAVLPERMHMTTVSNTHEKAHIITKVVKVEKPLSAWQRFRIGAFWWLLLTAAALSLWTFRKPLRVLLKKVATRLG